MLSDYEKTSVVLAAPILDLRSPEERLLIIDDLLSVNLLRDDDISQTHNSSLLEQEERERLFLIIHQIEELVRALPTELRRSMGFRVEPSVKSGPRETQKITTLSISLNESGVDVNGFETHSNSVSVELSIK